MRFALHIALSHLRSRSKEAGVSAITLISIGGVTIGVAALIAVMSVMAGFEVDLRDKILGSNAHVVVTHPNYTAMASYDRITQRVRDTEGVTGAAPFIYTEMMLKSPGGVSGVIVKGIDPNQVSEVLDLMDNIIEGPAGRVGEEAVAASEDVIQEQARILGLLKTPVAGMGVVEEPAEADPTAEAPIAPKPGIIVGDELATELSLYPGDVVHLVNPVGGRPGPMGTQVPEIKSFAVSGIFHSGMYEYDTKWAYVHMEEAQSFLRMKGLASGIEAKVADVDKVHIVAEALSAELGPAYRVRHWRELNSALFEALKLEKVVMGLILGLIVAVASLNIGGTLILLVLSKGREISILRAMGATTRQIRTVFMLEGVIIGIVGSGIGTVLGLSFCFALRSYGFPLDTDVYYLDSLPVVIQPGVVASVGLIGIAICFLATLYPATRAANLDPVEGLRNE
jgi:lipoprotein-releasing system permease protein